jgi:hypothetical protein
MPVNCQQQEVTRTYVPMLLTNCMNTDQIIKNKQLCGISLKESNLYSQSEMSPEASFPSVA